MVWGLTCNDSIGFFFQSDNARYRQQKHTNTSFNRNCIYAMLSYKDTGKPRAQLPELASAVTSHFGSRENLGPVLLLPC